MGEDVGLPVTSLTGGSVPAVTLATVGDGVLTTTATGWSVGDGVGSLVGSSVSTSSASTSSVSTQGPSVPLTTILMLAELHSSRSSQAV